MARWGLDWASVRMLMIIEKPYKSSFIGWWHTHHTKIFWTLLKLTRFGRGWSVDKIPMASISRSNRRIRRVNDMFDLEMEIKRKNRIEAIGTIEIFSNFIMQTPVSGQF